MSIPLLLLTIAAFLLLLIVAAIRPHHSKINMFELERRTDLGDRYAEKLLTREKLLTDVASLQRVSAAVLQVVVVLLSELTFGFNIGVVVAFLVALEHGAIARLSFISKTSQKLYNHYEDHILRFIQKTPLVIRLLRSAPNGVGQAELHIDSRQELQHLVAESDGVLTTEEKKLIVNCLSFNDKLVRTVMTPKEEIISIKRSEFLGPLVLDELHNTGRSRLPVISSDINHVVGILHLDNLLALDIKRSTTAEKAMEPKVFYIRDNQTLEHALAAFLSTRHYLFIVVNESRETVGLVTLEDVIESLIGREIEDEFDTHDNLRSVASREIKPKH